MSNLWSCGRAECLVKSRQRQSCSIRGRMMLRLSILLVVLTHPIRTAYVTNTPSFAARLDRFYEKLERLTVAPPKETTTESKSDQWYHKIQKLNSLSPDNFYLSDEDEDLLVAMQSWGRLSADQLDGVAKELQRIRDEKEDDRSERLTEQDYGDIMAMDDNDDEYVDVEYHNDGKEDEDDEEMDTSSLSPRPAAVTPSAFTRDEPTLGQTIVSAVDPIAATNERPRILNDETLTAQDRSVLRQAALSNIARVVRAGKCLVPQPRWLMVRQLAPAADTVYMPPCVELHRCAPDSGCCNSEAEVCAPIDGKYVALPFYLRKADGNMSVARIMFFNHTKCACVSRETLQTTIRNRPRPEHRLAREEERQNDSHAPTEPPKDNEDVTAPPQMRRCTCPAQFLASMSESGPCNCVCDWPDVGRRRNCLPLARGDEHFGLRDRVCVKSGDCSPPSCKFGAYDREMGKCPARKYRRFRYHARRYQPEKTEVV